MVMRRLYGRSVEGVVLEGVVVVVRGIVWLRCVVEPRRLMSMLRSKEVCSRLRMDDCRAISVWC